MSLLATLLRYLGSTIVDVLPIVGIVIFFQGFVLRRQVPHLPRLLWGMLFVILGLTMFLYGLQLALFPLGETMARQLTETVLPRGSDGEWTSTATQIPRWFEFYYVYLFAFTIGMSTTIAEPALIAVAMKAQEVSGGTLPAKGLRLAVAVGAGTGVMLGTLRIVLGIPLPYFILTGYLAVVIQTYFAPRAIIAIAYDSGGVTTSTVTVPVVAALGLGLASQIPDRNPVAEGFGLIAFTALFPIMSVMAYAQIAAWRIARASNKKTESAPSSSS